MDESANLAAASSDGTRNDILYLTDMKPDVKKLIDSHTSAPISFPHVREANLQSDHLLSPSVKV